MAEFASASPHYRLREAIDADVPSIARLYARVEPDDPVTSDEYARTWRWLHQANPTGRSKVLIGVDSAGEVVGHVALVPFAFFADGTECTAGFPCQLMVDERLRRTLLYPQMVKQLFREYPEAGFDCAYAQIVRPRVLQSNIALGFKPLGGLPVYVRPYRIARPIREALPAIAAGPIDIAGEVANAILRLRVPWPRRGILVRPLERFDTRVEPLCRSLREGPTFRARRSTEILNWRFIDPPDRVYQVLGAWAGGDLIGYAATRRMLMQGFDVLAVVDLVVRPAFATPAARALLQAIHARASNLGVELSACMLSPHDPLKLRLFEAGFLPSPERFTLVVHEPAGRVSHVSADSFPRWRVSWFDHDFV
ncbi:MAG: GNAT family N-acetyltransferase [Chloroflexi bacterium]|nr:GNAT family N-acetyltransferase [Chloroflexota bacterium]